MRPTDIDRLLTQITYPTSTDEIIRTYGTDELRHQEGTETVEQVIGRCGPETYRDEEDVRLALYASVCSDAVGRRWYSDRDPPILGSDGPDPVSF